MQTEEDSGSLSVKEEPEEKQVPMETEEKKLEMKTEPKEEEGGGANGTVSSSPSQSRRKSEFSLFSLAHVKLIINNPKLTLHSKKKDISNDICLYTVL